jgi:dimethylargininase
MHFSYAIVRPPASTFANGITSATLGPPDLALALEQHEAYCEVLERLGLSLVRLPPDPKFPDSTFVEDAAIVTGRGAILTRPGAPSRAGEVTAMSAVLERWFPDLDRIKSPGTVDGGDVCEAGEHFFIGLSHRTNEDGAAQLSRWLAARGFDCSVIDIRKPGGSRLVTLDSPPILHLKTGLSWLGGRRLIALRELAGHEAFRGWEILEVPKGEEYAANCILVNGSFLVASGFPRTAVLLRGQGAVLELEMSEYQKMDGGLSCLSVRW